MFWWKKCKQKLAQTQNGLESTFKDLNWQTFRTPFKSRPKITFHQFWTIIFTLMNKWDTEICSSFIWRVISFSLFVLLLLLGLNWKWPHNWPCLFPSECASLRFRNLYVTYLNGLSPEWTRRCACKWDFFKNRLVHRMQKWFLFGGTALELFFGTATFGLPVIACTFCTGISCCW